MFKKKIKNLYSKINWKKMGLFSLILFAIISVISIILVSLTFARDVNKNYSKEFGDKLQIEYNLMLPKKYDETKDLDVIKNASNSINGQLSQQGFQDYGIQYGLEKSCPETKVTYQLASNLDQSFDFGTFYLTFNINDPLLNFDKKLILKNVGKKNDKGENILSTQDLNSLAKNQFVFATSFNKNFNIRLQQATKFTTGTSNNENNNFLKNIPISNKNNVEYDEKTSSVLAKLPAPISNSTVKVITENSNATYWDLNSFQKEFVTNFSTEWNEKGNHADVISGLGTDFNNYKSPKQTYIYWTDRSNLISRLQTVILFTYLYNNYKNKINSVDASFTPVQKFLSEKIYENFTVFEKDFAGWVVQRNNIKNVLHSLNHALVFDQTNTVDASADDLLKVLNDYYTTGNTSNNIIGPITADEQTQLDSYKNTNSSTNNIDKVFLYSWNLAKNPLLSNYVKTIDYANFFNYFTDNTEDKYKSLNPNWQDDQSYAENFKKYKNDNYFSQNFKLNPEEFQLSEKTLVDILNNYKVEYSYFNSNLYALDSLNLNNSTFNPEVWKIATNYFDYLNLIEQPNLKSPITLPSYISSFIGILAIIIIVGIIVSILYRIPGLFASFVSLLSFSIGSLAFVELHLPFSFNVVFNLLISSLSVYIPIIYLFDYFKIGIKRGLNITNSLIFSFKKFLKISIAINITLLIIGLVFLFFGIVQLQTFGSILVIISLLSILFGTILYFGIFFITIKILHLNFKMSLFLSSKYVAALNKISNSKFKLENIDIPQLEDKNIISKTINLMVFRNVKKNWMFYALITIITLMFIGLIVFFALGSPFSVNFSDNNEIVLQTAKEISNNSLNQLAEHLGIKVFEINKNVISIPGKDAEILNGFEYVIISTNNVSWQSLNNSLSTVNFSSLGFNSLEQFLNSISIRENNNDISILIKDNLIKCLFISLAFLLVWALVWLNVINVISVFIILLFNILTIVGVMNVTRIIFDLDSLIAGLNVFVYFSIITFLNLCDFKINYKFKEKLDKEQMNEFINNSLKFSLFKNIAFNLTILLSVILMFLFMSSEFVWAISLFILSFIIIALVNLIITINFFYLAILIRQKTINDQKVKLLHKYLKREKKEISKKDFDKVDEQTIMSINKFKY